MDVRAIDWDYLTSLLFEQQHGFRLHTAEELQVLAELIADGIEEWRYRVVKMRPDETRGLRRKIDVAMKLVI